MAGIELQAEVNRAGAALPSGAYLYTALVHLHRSSAHRSPRTATASFFNQPRMITIPYLMGTRSGTISSTYFAGVLSPEEVIRRHTLFGYVNLSIDKEDANNREKALIPDYFGLNFSIDRVKHLRWCKNCSDEELDVYGFASWKVMHQISSVRICHIHGSPLLSQCNNCGNLLGAINNFRLPGDACPNCRKFDFSGETIGGVDAYKVLLKSMGMAFQNQEEYFRFTEWNRRVAKFIENFSSWFEAHRALEEYLCQTWDASSLSSILELLKTPLPARGTLFSCGDRHLSVRILLSNAMWEICPFLRSITVNDVDNPPSAELGVLHLPSVIKQHARMLKINERVADALCMPLNVKQAANAVGVDYATTSRDWNKILDSMRLKIPHEEISELLPGNSRVAGLAACGNTRLE